MAGSKEAYEEKFKTLLSLIAAARERGVECLLINSPQQLGDTVDEMVESLYRISEADLSVRFLDKRAK